MDESTKVTTEIPDRHLGVSCGVCNRETRHKVLAQTETSWTSRDGQIDIWEQFQIVQCQGCLEISFRQASQCTEDFDFDPDTGDTYLNDTVKLFPNRISGRPVMGDVEHLPHIVYGIYQEAHGALCANLGILAGFGLRAIVEAVCNDRGITIGNLQEKIDQLARSGHITDAGAKILHSLRFMGNVAAHEMKSHSPQQINAAFDVVEYLLQGVYVITRQAKILPGGEKI